MNIDMSGSLYLGSYPITIYISFYNYGIYSLPQINFENLDFEPRVGVYGAAGSGCINGCYGR